MLGPPCQGKFRGPTGLIPNSSEMERNTRPPMSGLLFGTKNGGLALQRWMPCLAAAMKLGNATETSHSSGGTLSKAIAICGDLSKGYKSASGVRRDIISAGRWESEPHAQHGARHPQSAPTGMVTQRDALRIVY